MFRSAIVLLSVMFAYWGLLKIDLIPQHYSAILCQSALLAGFMWVAFAGMTQSFHDECSRYTKRVEKDVCEQVERLFGSFIFCYVVKLPSDDESFKSRCLPAPFIPPRVASA
ncbi:hypothetical protein [Solimicrobium silvestre]|nr:hypothetical protein [Solimicrobium silvestre]